tara:strand:+ start:21168 stop:21536 length:369 start_codon:yes stop_codon:yes gene_type:complete
MDNGQIPEEDYRKLYGAFVNAIGNSKEIRAIIENLRERNKINSISMFALIVKLEELLDSSSLPAKTNLPAVKKKEKTKCLNETAEGEYIDGEKLTPNEIAFEEFCRKNFDEEKWLIENRIKF